MASERNKVKTGANAIGFTVVVVALVILFNVIATRYFKRIDFTQDRVYTLSKPSKELVSALPDKLTIKAFISADLQPPFSQVAQYTRDLLEEYAQASKGKLKWEAIDPGSDPKLEEEATKMKVPKMQRGRVSNDKVEIGSSYLGIALQYQGNVESIPEIGSFEGLEFELDKRIRMLTSKKPKIAIATSEGELSIGGGGDGHGGLQAIKQYLDYYDLVPVALNTGPKPIADDVQALIIAGPKQPMSERAKFVVDQFLMHGKAVFFLVDGMVLESPRQMQIPGQAAPPMIGRKNDAGLDDLLEHYGFKVRDDLIMEPRRNVPGPGIVQGQPMLGNHAAFVITNSLAESSPILAHVEALVLPFCSSLELVKGKQPGLTVTQLVASSRDAWRQTGFFLFDLTQQPKPSGDERGPFPLAYLAEGKLKSFFAGKPYPNEKGEKVQPAAANASLPPGEEKPLDESVAPARIVLVGNSNVASDEYFRLMRMVPTYGVNLQFMVNTIEYLAQDKSLGDIRAKGVAARPITVSSDSTSTLIKYGNVVGVPLAFILFGVARWRLRTARRARARL